MPSTTLPADASSKTVRDSKQKDPSTSVLASFERVRTSLQAYLAQPANAELWRELLISRRCAAALIAELPRQKPEGPLVSAARDVVRAVSVSGVHDTRVSADDIAFAHAAAGRGWSGVLAAMLLTPAWQWPDAPALQALPDWFWGDYAAWLFATPQGFCAPGDADNYAAHVLHRLEELSRWADRNAGSAAVRKALEAYVRHATSIPLYFSRTNLRRHAELRGRILRRAVGQRDDGYDSPAIPRAGRRLRVGFVNRHFGPQTETYTTLPTFEQLDPERFEVLLFAHSETGSPLEIYCRQHAKEFHLLTGDVSEQLSTLRGATLDVVVFGTNVTAVCNEVTLLALHRVAPLQVLNNSSCITSGLPEVDVYVSGDLTETDGAAAHFSERLALLPGPAHAFNYQADQQAATVAFTRDNLGVPPDATVFVTAANYFKIIPEMQLAWARLLAAVPGSYLLVHPFNPNWSSSYPIDRFCAEFERVLVQQGVDGKRLLVSTAKFPSRLDVKELLRLGDIYLDTFPFGGVNSLVDPLELGIPVVAWEGDSFRARMGSALLKSLGLPQLIATNEEQYREIAARLAADREFRADVAAKVASAMESNPVFLDPLAASDAFGDLLETAYDELVEVDRKAFRANPIPLRASGADPSTAFTAGAEALADGNHALAVEQARQALRAAPADSAARRLLGQALVAAGQLDRGIDYLLAALHGPEGVAAGLWFDLARALRARRRLPQALEALENALRLEQTNVEGWIMFAELAQAIGSADIAGEAAGVARQLAPNDARVVALTI